MADSLTEIVAFFMTAAKAKVATIDTVNQLIAMTNLNNTAPEAIVGTIIAYDESNLVYQKLIKEDFWKMTTANAKAEDQIRGALAIGEYGKIKDMSSEADKVIATVQGLFESKNEEVRIAGSRMLGGVTTGNPSTFLARLFDMMGKAQGNERQQLLTTVLAIIRSSPICLKDNVVGPGSVCELLMEYVDNAEDIIRNTVSECFGRLFLVFSEDVITYYVDGFKGDSGVVQKTFVESVKFFGSKAEFNEPMMLRTVADDIVSLKAQTDPELKKNALEALTFIVQTNSQNFEGIKDCIGDILEFAFQETQVRPELIEEIDLGPFKQKIDKGLPMRKAAFHLLETTYLRTPDAIDIDKFMEVVVGGLGDPDEIMLVLLLNIVVKLTSRSCVVVLSRIEALVAALEKLQKVNLKNVHTQERAMNIARAVIRVAYTIEKTPELDDQPSP